MRKLKRFFRRLFGAVTAVMPVLDRLSTRIEAFDGLAEEARRIWREEIRPWLERLTGELEQVRKETRAAGENARAALEAATVAKGVAERVERQAPAGVIGAPTAELGEELLERWRQDLATEARRALSEAVAEVTRDLEQRAGLRHEPSGDAS